MMTITETHSTFSTVHANDLLDHSRLLLRKLVRYALLSPDPSTQNAAVLTTSATTKPLSFGTPIIDTWAVNEFPSGIAYTPERWERPLKYAVIEHAERNAIYAATKARVGSCGLTMVAVWAACSDCARAIIQTGIHTLVTLAPPLDPHGHWGASIDTAMGLLSESGVRVIFVEGSLGCDFTIRRNGEDVAF